MNKHVSRVSRELSDARERLGRADSDSESDGEGGKTASHADKEKPTEEMVDRMEERLEAAQADQKNLFLIIFQVRVRGKKLVQSRVFFLIRNTPLTNRKC